MFAMTATDKNGNQGIWAVTVDGEHKPQLLVDLPVSVQKHSVFSPDGKWIAYMPQRPAGTRSTFSRFPPPAQSTRFRPTMAGLHYGRRPENNFSAITFRQTSWSPSIFALRWHSQSETQRRFPSKGPFIRCRRAITTSRPAANSSSSFFPLPHRQHHPTSRTHSRSMSWLIGFD